MKGFRRAQLRGSDELFRATDDPPVRREVVRQEVMAVEVQEVRPVPAAPSPDSRSVRLSRSDIEVLADALQHLKFPHQQMVRPSMERFEQLESLRQKLLDSI